MAESVQARFAALIESLESSVPNAAMRAKLRQVSAARSLAAKRILNHNGALQGLQQLFDAPPAAEVEAVTFQHVTVDQVRTLRGAWSTLLMARRVLLQVRCMLFFPDVEQVTQYPTLILSPPDGAPADHPQARVQQAFLGMLCMKHTTSWRLMREFVLSVSARVAHCRSLHCSSCNARLRVASFP